jgi:hypothetical protein
VARPGGPPVGHAPGRRPGPGAVGMVASTLIAQGWRRPVTSQRDERLERTAASRMVTISSALAKYENALQAARSLWLASDSVDRRAVPGWRLPPRRAPVHDPDHRGRAARRAGGPGQPGRQRARGLPGRRPGRAGDALHLWGADLRAALRAPGWQPDPGWQHDPDRAHHPGVAAARRLLWLLAQVGSLYREVGRLARTDKGTCSIGVATWDRREEATALVARADRPCTPPRRAVATGAAPTPPRPPSGGASPGLIPGP